MDIVPGRFYKTKDGNYVVVVTSIAKNPALKDLEIEYYLIETQCFSSQEYFMNNFKEVIQ